MKEKRKSIHERGNYFRATIDVRVFAELEFVRCAKGTEKKNERQEFSEPFRERTRGTAANAAGALAAGSRTGHKQ